MEDNSNKENQDIEILEKENEDKQKKQSCTTDTNPLFKGLLLQEEDLILGMVLATTNPLKSQPMEKSKVLRKNQRKERYQS